jgi:hypothetical protein
LKEKKGLGTGERGLATVSIMSYLLKKKDI